MSLTIAIFAQIFSLGVGIFSYYKNSISKSGFAALLFISSSMIWLDKLPFLFILFYMFASSSILTKYKKSLKREFIGVIARSGPRNHIQAISNLGVASLLAIGYHFYPDPILIAAFVGSVAGGNADSWASEIGGLSKQKPILITNLKPVDKGISGGITLLGTLGGSIGSLFIALSSIGMFAWLQPLPDYLTIFMAGFIGGIFGLLFDSYLGAKFQVLYSDSRNNKATEDKQIGNTIIKGYSWIDNDMVNLLTTLASAIVAALLYYLLK